jgi:hypothetical protein
VTQVTVLVRSDVAKALQQGSPTTPPARDILQAAQELSVSLAPMHPGVDDPNLSGYFIANAADERAAQRVVERLRSLEAIEAAYVKPPEALP